MTRTAPAVDTERWAARRRRAEELRARHEFAAGPLELYLRLLDAREGAYERALVDRPDAGSLPRYAVERALPAVMDATMDAGTELLREATLLRFHDGSLEEIVARWLRGEELDPTDRYLARAAAGPILEALPETARELRDEDAGRGCPLCGAAPQLGYFAESGESLVTGPRTLVCSRCSGEWRLPRMTCAVCGETDTHKLPIYTALELYPHLRVDACESCRRYLVTVDLRKDARAVPEVDELVAIPLDLSAHEHGFEKAVLNLMGM